MFEFLGGGISARERAQIEGAAYDVLSQCEVEENEKAVSNEDA